MKWLFLGAYFSLAISLVAAEVYCAFRTVTGWPGSAEYFVGTIVFFCLYWLVRQTIFPKMLALAWRGVPSK